MLEWLIEQLWSMKYSRMNREPRSATKEKKNAKRHCKLLQIIKFHKHFESVMGLQFWGQDRPTIGDFKSYVRPLHPESQTLGFPVRLYCRAVCTLPPVTRQHWENLARPNSWQAQTSKQKVATGGVGTDEQKREDCAQLSKVLSRTKTLENLANFWQWRQIKELINKIKLETAPFFEGHLTHSVFLRSARLSSSSELGRSHQLSWWGSGSAEEQKGRGKSQ